MPETLKIKKRHVELYLQNGEVIESWNKSYADGGFTQVFEEMNDSPNAGFLNNFKVISIRF